MYHLTVIHPFQAGEGGKKYRRGDRITDEAEVKAVLEGEHAHRCHRTQPGDGQAAQ